MNFGKWLGLFSLITSLYVLWEIRQLLLLVFTAVIFATALNRFVGFLQRLGIKRNLGIVIIICLAVPLAFLLIALIVPPFVEQFQELIALLPRVWETLRADLSEIALKQYDWLPPLPNLNDLIAQLQPLATNLFKNFVGFFSGSVTVILQVLLVFVLTLMILANPQTYRQGFLLLFPSFYRRRGDEILTKTEVAIVNWLGGIAINCLFIGTLSGVGLWLLQVKLVLVHALLAGLLNFIPNIGPTTSVVFPIMVVLIDTPWKIGPILIWYFIIQNIESYWLTPTVMAKQVSLLPAVTLMAQIFFAQIFGLVGLLLALPLTVVAKTWIEEVLLIDILDQWGGESTEVLHFPAEEI
ncbi:MAG: AI-2E family transporter [Gomphosphaeria aponina SAG 52.96 = DSM 107014]|uniref:AI-2E family transporter n=1 Tax=Gomphosphaeria aponina SAG 52.96 = DSM 107014 TaxID=1521640 RepID=A0A941GPF9_9CHRO|nr:AI-2E family transporter [Gomphosphaeria aponina SAG 52.96 = DSM 107014]